jgi:hypothetical protein
MPPVKRWIVYLGALTLLWIIVPGVVEATENLVHLARIGHLAHAEESGDSHSDPSPEHGCDGLFHLCSCHLTLTGLPVALEQTPAAADQGALSLGRLVRAVPGHMHNLEHPPRA